jgi:hypothetical protein
MVWISLKMRADGHVLRRGYNKSGAVIHCVLPDHRHTEAAPTMVEAETRGGSRGRARMLKDAAASVEVLDVCTWNAYSTGD